MVDIVWSSVTSYVPDKEWISITYGIDKFVAVSIDGALMYSTDIGISWTNVNLPSSVSSNQWTSVTFGKRLGNIEQFVAVSRTPENIGTHQFITSIDGIEWEALNIQDLAIWTCVANGDNTFIAVSFQGKISKSPNGVNWSPITQTINQQLQSVVYGNGKFVVISFNNTKLVMYSTDNGNSWTTEGVNDIPAGVWTSIAFGHNKFVAVSASGEPYVITSDDGLTWIPAEETPRGPMDSAWSSITYGSGLFVAVARNNTGIMYSKDDGATWVFQTPPENNSWESVAYGDGVFIAVSRTGTNRVMRGVVQSDICMVSGTLVLTDNGYIEINRINPNKDTINGKEILCISKTVQKELYLVCFEKDSLGINVPSKRTILTPGHKINYNNKMVEAKYFVGKHNNIRKIEYTGETLYNVLMEKHDTMIVHNLLVETLNPDNELAQLYYNEL